MVRLGRPWLFTRSTVKRTKMDDEKCGNEMNLYLMECGVVYYKYESHKEYNDVDVEATTELGTIKIRRYHFKNEKFTRSVQSGRFEPDRPYDFPIAMLGSGDTLGTYSFGCYRSS
ncbi:hypothetical protein PIB30_022471 [Stylosanthes scabra]|uniref:Jacalin-type lectin domain-containing protein n=1 Tax=Stylosanthes scabra TaxID=79078 RepID=A0ABU6T9W1_9FABA|nr:hypothetical protein [Stylosanthes scabra]